jgi:hypothetical protein
MIKVDVMPRSFVCRRKSSSVGVDGSVCDIIDVCFIKSDHLRRQGKYREAVDALVPEKTQFEKGLGPGPLKEL